jgi:CRP-like cAMP-binding protein
MDGSNMNSGALGKSYPKDQVIIKQGEIGNCMYVIQSGKVEVLQHENGKTVCLSVLGPGDFFGEMAIFEEEARSATIRALEDCRILTIDKKNFIQRIHEDPTLALHLVKMMSRRLRELNNKHTRIRANDRRNWDDRPERIDVEERELNAGTSTGIK